MLSITTLLGCLSSVSAEPYWLQKPVQCAEPQEVVTHQAKIYREIPFLMLYGKSLTTTGTFKDVSYILSVNMEMKLNSYKILKKKRSTSCAFQKL